MMSTRFRLFLLIWLVSAAQECYAQLNNNELSDHIAISNDSNRFGFSISSFNYLRNTEYFNNIELGRTLFGTQLHPKAFIQPNRQFLLEAGLFLQSDFGANPAINKILPTFSVKVTNPGHTRSFIFGTLEGALAHRLVEPLFDINSAIERRIESGAQFKITRDRLFLDTWINWENFIERGSPYKEQFTAGLNLDPTLLSTKNGLTIRVPIQGTAFHRGGQIDADTTNMVMIFNAAAGLEVKKSIQGKLIHDIGVSIYSLYYMENSNSGYYPWRNGNGSYLNAFIKTGALDVMASYWIGNDFIAPRGTVLYQSMSTDIPGLTESQRALLFVRFLHRQELLKNLYLTARFEPVFDLRNDIFDFSYSVYLSYRFNHSSGYTNAQ